MSNWVGVIIILAVVIFLASLAFSFYKTVPAEVDEEEELFEEESPEPVGVISEEPAIPVNPFLASKAKWAVKAKSQLSDQTEVIRNDRSAKLALTTNAGGIVDVYIDAWLANRLTKYPYDKLCEALSELTGLTVVAFTTVYPPRAKSVKKR